MTFHTFTEKIARMQLQDYFDKIYVATITDVASAILSAFIVHWTFSLCMTFDPLFFYIGWHKPAVFP